MVKGVEVSTISGACPKDDIVTSGMFICNNGDSENDDGVDIQNGVNMEFIGDTMQSY